VNQHRRVSVAAPEASTAAVYLKLSGASCWAVDSLNGLSDTTLYMHCSKDKLHCSIWRSGQCKLNVETRRPSFASALGGAVERPGDRQDSAAFGFDNHAGPGS
jgi:hypothetical protein